MTTTMQELLLNAVEQRQLRRIDAQFAMMVAKANNNDPALMLAAALVSKDAGDGHVCLPLSRLVDGKTMLTTSLQRCFSALEALPDWRLILLSSPAVSENGESPAPLILSGNRLYLNRLWRHERAVAYFFGKANQPLSYNRKTIIRTLNALFGVDNDNKEINWQKVAAAVALTRRISVIAGGPGTGKTTAVAKLLAALVQLPGKENCRIQLAAPTGRAAARLTETLGNALRHLKLTDLQIKHFPVEASTLHRLLGAQQGSQRLRYHAGNQLHLDVLVIDEASMIDLTMMSRLIDALPAHAQVVYLGDRDQLASVEAGAVLGDICTYASEGYTTHRAQELAQLTGYALEGRDDIAAGALRDSICLLQKSYRFGINSGLGQLAVAVNLGDCQAVQALFSRGFSDIKKRALHSYKSYLAMLEEVMQGYQSFLLQVQQQASPASIIAEFAKYQLLCALKDGSFGVTGLNERLERELSKKRKIKLMEHSQWYEGRPIMILRNDSVLGLFNGDIGIALDRGKGLRVWFRMLDGSVKSVQTSLLPDYETAWAMTVHKSQGSEFEHVALILPWQMTPVLTRELVYTAITRARCRLSLYADDSILSEAISTRTERRSGLGEIFSQL